MILTGTTAPVKFYSKNIVAAGGSCSGLARTCVRRQGDLRGDTKRVFSGMAVRVGVSCSRSAVLCVGSLLTSDPLWFILSRHCQVLQGERGSYGCCRDSGLGGYSRSLHSAWDPCRVAPMIGAPLFSAARRAPVSNRAPEPFQRRETILRVGARDLRPAGGGRTARAQRRADPAPARTRVRANTRSPNRGSCEHTFAPTEHTFVRTDVRPAGRGSPSAGALPHLVLGLFVP